MSILRNIIKPDNLSGLHIITYMLLFILISNTSFPQDADSKHFKIQKISEGIYAVIHSIGGYAICNAGIIDLGDKTLVYDTFLSPLAARELRTAAEVITKKVLKGHLEIELVQ